jgi:hypothetical protein
VRTQSDIHDQRYQTEPDIGPSDIGLKCGESDIISDIGITFIRYPISDMTLVTYYDIKKYNSNDENAPIYLAKNFASDQ